MQMIVIMTKKIIREATLAAFCSPERLTKVIKPIRIKDKNLVENPTGPSLTWIDIWRASIAPRIYMEAENESAKKYRIPMAPPVAGPRLLDRI